MTEPHDPEEILQNLKDLRLISGWHMGPCFIEVYSAHQERFNMAVMFEDAAQAQALGQVKKRAV
jgi:hypothetical protein